MLTNYIAISTCGALKHKSKACLSQTRKAWCYAR